MQATNRRDLEHILGCDGEFRLEDREYLSAIFIIILIS